MEKYIKDALCDFRDQRAIELFDRKECDIHCIGEKMLLEMYIRDYMNPIWKDIIYDGNSTGYQVNNLGECVNSSTGKKLTQSLDKDGYRKVVISINDIRKQFMVHRLVANAFIPNPENKPEVNHQNCNKTFNWVGNLEWVTRKENFDHARMMGLENHIGQGESNITHKFSEEQIKEVCQLLETPINRPIDIRRKTGVSKGVINGIKAKRLWKHISSNYNINDINLHYGEYNNKNKYSEDMIHKICKMLEDPHNNPKKISDTLNVPRSIVQSIKDKSTWVNISSNYNFPDTKFKCGENHANNKYEESQIRSVCEMLKSPYNSYAKISRDTGVKTDTVFHIAIGKVWKDISDAYGPFPGRSNKKSDIILDMYKSGKSNSDIYDKLCEVSGEILPRRRTLNHITDAIRRYNKNHSL